MAENAEKNLQPYVDRRWTIKREIKRLEDELKEIDEVLKTEMSPGEIVLSSEGVGYRLSEAQKREFTSGAFQKLQKWGLLQHFASISTAKLEGLRRKNLISTAQIADLEENHSFFTSSFSLREYVPEDTKLFS